MYNYNMPTYNPYSSMAFNGSTMPNNSFLTPGQQITKVHGKDGINALNIAPNSTMLCLDETEPIVWFVQTDGAGYKTPTAYDITPHVSNEIKLQNNLETRISRLEEIIYAKSDIKSNATEQSNTNNTENVKSSKKFNG